ncbi:acid protease [Trametes polyzona]|nr:acid protease [Trametes polyzona]
MYTSSWCTLFLVLLPALVPALPLPARTTSPRSRKGGIVLPFNRHSRRVAARDADDGEVLGGTVGLGDSADLFYTVAVTIGNSTTAVNLDTGSSDLWVMSTACRTKQCRQSNAKPYDVSESFKPSGNSVNLRYGDSTTGTHADGPVGRDTVTLAGLTLEDQTLAAINDTNNSAVGNGGAGILGLGFPAQSFVQAAAISAEFPSTSGTDTFVEQTAKSGPIVPRLILADEIDDPLFAITLQRNTIDVSGEGQITIGQLPEDVDNSTITWVPVRLYDPVDGGLEAPSFAPNEKYPLRWEVEIDAVYLDGKKLADSTQEPTGIKKPSVSALIDTGNSLMRGPSDVVNNILSTVSPAYAANPNAQPLLPCDEGHTLSFQIGGKLFPVDPRDFISQHKRGDATNCVASSVVSTDPPSLGALFSWNLGDPFLKSNMVVFYYGNLTHPSVDPPRMGFVSLVPQNAEALLDDAVEDAQKAGGMFEAKADSAPTASSLILEGATDAPGESTSSKPAPARTSSPLTPSPLATTAAATSPASPTPSSAPTGAAVAPAASPSPRPNSAQRALGHGGRWRALALPTLALLLSLCVL